MSIENKIDGHHNCFLCNETHKGQDYKCPMYVTAINHPEQCVYSVVAQTDMKKHGRQESNVTLGQMLMAYLEYKNQFHKHNLDMFKPHHDI